jgi:hypothetical protein
MPINLVEGQLASGAFNSTSGPATLPAGTTAGNTVILICDTNASGGFTLPTGFTLVSPTFAGVSNKLAVYRKANVGAGETSYTVTVGGGATAPVAWEIREYEGIDAGFPEDVKPAALDGTASGTSLEAGPTPISTVYDGLLLVAFGAHLTGGTAPTWSGHTGGVVEETDQGSVGAVVAVGLSVALMPVQSLAAWASTATCSATAALSATAIVFAAAGAKRLSDPINAWGFEWRTAAGLVTTDALGNGHFGTQTGSPEVVDDATKARTGSGYLRLQSTAAAENVADALRPLTVAGTPQGVLQRRCIRFDGGLPSVDTELFHVELNMGGGNLVVRFIAATGKLGAKIGTGTEQVSDAAVTADVWIAVDVRLTTTTTAHTADWQVTYDATPGASSTPVAQPQVSFTASTTPTSYTSRIGWTGAITPGVPVLYDDCVDSVVAGAYPLGDHRIWGLKVDPAATPTVSGTVGNFALVTNNATGATLTSPTLTSARDAIDEAPPTIGASADGVCQITAAAGDYLRFDMETYNASGTGSIRAVKQLVCGWAAAATAGTVGWRWLITGSEGAPTPVDRQFDNSTTAPCWVTSMLKPAGGWTQARLDGVKFDFGFSDDATPDQGIHAPYLEVTVQNAVVGPLFGDLASATQDPVTGGVLAVAATPTGGYDATLHYEESGSPTDVPAPGGTTTTEVIDAPDAPAVEYVALYPPAEDISDA